MGGEKTSGLASVLWSGGGKGQLLVWVWDKLVVSLSLKEKIIQVHLKADFSVVNLFCFLFFKRFIDLFERERNNRRQGQRKRERESQADSVLSTDPDVGLDFTTLRSDLN